MTTTMTTTAILALCCTAALPLLAAEPQSPQPDKQEWQRRFLDRVNNQLIWNADRSIAVGYQSIGASCNSIVYWCFRATVGGSMELFACYTFQSDIDTTPTPRITGEGLELDFCTPHGRLTHRFPFSQPRASLEYWAEKDSNAQLEDCPGYGDMQDLNKR